MTIKISSKEVRIENAGTGHAPFQTLDEFQREYFPDDFKLQSTPGSSEALLQDIAKKSAVLIKAAFARAK